MGNVVSYVILRLLHHIHIIFLAYNIQGANTLCSEDGNDIYNRPSQNINFLHLLIGNSYSMTGLPCNSVQR